MKKLLITLISLLAPLSVLAINITVPSAPTNGYFLTSTSTGAYIATTTDPAHFGSIYATSTSENSYFAGTLTFASLTSPQLIYVGTNGLIQTVATTTASCSGNASCNTFTIIGSSPITISATGGSGSGTWSTTTSSVANHYINYPNNATDIVVIGDTSTTTAPFWYDPNTKNFYIRNASTTFDGSPISFSAFSQGLAYLGTGSQLKTTSTSTLGLGNSLQITGGSLGYQIGGSNVTIDTIQDIRTSASPSFTGLTISGATSPQLFYAGSGGVVKTVATSTLTASSPLTGSFTQVGSGGSLGCTTASSGVAGCLSNTAFDTFNNKLGSYDAWTHPTIRYSATTSVIGLGTSTPEWELNVASSTAPQLALTSTGANIWTMRETGGYLYFATASPTTWATSTASALTVNQNGYLGIGTSSPGTLLSIGNGINFDIATSTFNTSGGINLATGGCFAISGTCLSTSGSLSAYFVQVQAPTDTSYAAKTYSMKNGDVVEWWATCSRGSSNTQTMGYKTTNDSSTTTLYTISGVNKTSAFGEFTATTSYSVTVEATFTGCDTSGQGYEFLSHLYSK